MTVFFRVLDVPPEGKAEALREVIRSVRSDGKGQSDDQISGRMFSRAPSSFAAIPGVALLYWLPEGILRLYGTRVGWQNIETRCGLGTLDDFQFLRCWWESHLRVHDWHAFAKGGAYSPWYSDIPLTIGWVRSGRGLKASVEQKVGSASRKIQGEDHYFLPGITWPRLPHNLGSFQVLPAGSIYSDGGPAMFAEDADRLLVVVALLNSAPYLYLLDSLMPRGSEGGQTLKYETGYVTGAPLPSPVSAAVVNELRALAVRGWSLARKLQSTNETARAFVLPEPIAAQLGSGLTRNDIYLELLTVQARVDEIAFELYGITGRDRDTIGAWCAERRSRVGGAGEVAADSTDLSEGDRPDVGPTMLETATPSNDNPAICWLVGVVFGRFDPRLATGERPIPPEPEPFDPLPSRSPGVYADGEEPADRPGILVDDEGHADDLAMRVRAVAERVKVDVPENLRGWLAKEFFPLHVKMYSKSRRKAPIYWQLATPSASYSVWLYVHAFSKDTLFRVQNDYVGGERGKLAHEERRLESMSNELRDGATAAQRKALAAQETLVEELRAFLDEVKRVAPLWKPNLDDGVIINFAPLWRLVPHHKAWQKELKATWDALCEGEYDWAHLAMHLWPERVVPKCAKDRSLAIAHGLEDVFWVEDTDGKRTARKTPARSLDELVRERTWLAVKSALKSLLEAPVASGKTTGRKGGGRRKAAAADERGDA